MTRKKDTPTTFSPENNAQIQHILEHIHQIAGDLHSSADRQQSEAVLTEISNMPEATQMTLLKTLSKEHDTAAADILLAINELSSDKILRKEARRSLIRLEEAKIYPRWQPPAATPAIQLPGSNSPRFWRGWVTRSREEGEVQLVLSWEQGYDYSEIRMLTFLLDFWEQGLKEFILEITNKRSAETRLQQMRAQLPEIVITDCALAEGRRLIEEALGVNKWRGTPTHKEYRHHLPAVRQLVLDAADAGEDRGLTFINPDLEADEVAATFVGAWTLGDFGLSYDLLTSNSSIRDGLERDEWIERRRAWANEARPTRFEMSFAREREPVKSALWIPQSFSTSRFSSGKEIEIGWSAELTDTQLSGTLKEMPMGTAVNKETGRHWFWTSYTLVQEEGQWRIQQMSDEGANAQGLSIAELQQRVQEHDDRMQEIVQQSREHTAAEQQAAEEISWRMMQAVHYDDALIAKLPLDRTFYQDAFSRTMSFSLVERSIVYLERMAQRFAEQRGAVLRQLGVAQEALGEYYFEHDMEERGKHFTALAEATVRESLKLENNLVGRAMLAEMLLKQGERLDEAEDQLQQAKELASNASEEAMIEANLGDIDMERKQLSDALQHFRRAAEIDPNFPHIWFKIGFMYRNLKQFADAQAAYKRAIEMEPQLMPPYSELTAIYLNEQKFQEAREIVEQGLHNIPKSAHLLALLSSVYYMEGDRRRAEAILAEAEQIDPNLDIVQLMREDLDKSRKK